jgi:glycosyltransferase involved in cell wall biosynthesis
MLELHTVFVLHSTGMAGGVKVVLEIANRLADAGRRIAIFTLDQEPSWFRNRTQLLTFEDYESLGNALASTSAFKVATLWRTAPVVAENSRPGEGLYLVQDIETCYEQAAAKEAVLGTYSLPLIKLTTSRWVQARLRELGAESDYIGVAIDQDIFNTDHATHRDDSILVNAPRSAHIAEVKGADILTEILSAIRTRDPGIHIVSYSPENQGLNVSSPYKHYPFPDDKKVSSLFQSRSCFLITSRHEGFCLPALEAMACGCPVVCTPANGNAEFCIPDLTCVSLDTVDPNVAAATVLDLLCDQPKQGVLRNNGIEIASNYRWDLVLKRWDDIL